MPHSRPDAPNSRELTKMNLHFERKVAYRDVGTGLWLAVSKNPTHSSYVTYTYEQPFDVPHPEAVFLLYVQPPDGTRCFLRAFDGRVCSRTGQLSGGAWTVKTSGGPSDVCISHAAHADTTPDKLIVQLTNVDTGEHPDERVTGSPTGSLGLLVLQTRVNPLFEHITLTPRWDNPQSWTDADLTYVDFRGMAETLPKVRSWAGADMARANFEGLDLRQVKFDDRAKLTGAKLRNVNLAGHDFGAANLDGADLTGANLAGAKLANASMLGTNFSGANLTGADFGAAPKFSKDASRRTSLSGATLDGVALSHWDYLDLRSTTMSVSSAGPVDARHADLRGATVRTAVLRGATLDDALLADADLSAADLVGARFDRCDLTATRLPAVLDDCRFVAADLSSLRLSGASLKRANLDESDLTGTVLVTADLTDATLRRATLHRASLSYARLVGADCTEAQLGATEKLFALPGASRSGWADGEPSTVVRDAFAAHGIALTRAARVTASAPHGGWLLADGDQLYRVSGDEADGDLAVHAYRSSDHAAVLTAAYMPNAIFDQAEMYAVHMSRAHWYGSGASAVGASLEQIDASGANLGQINLVQAKLMGANLGSTVLAGAHLRGAQLGMSAQSKQSSLDEAHLAGTDLTSASVHDAVMTDAAIAVEATAGGVSVIGVPLFPLAASFAATLDAGQLSAALRQAFGDGGYPLAADAKATKLSTGNAWEITQGHGDPQQMSNTYARLGIVLLDGELHVHGSELWITRLGPDGSLETVRFGYLATKLSAAELNATTTCPNGEPLHVNQAENRPWHEMMTALRSPPKPPECIPSPDSWDCPAPTSVRG